MYQIVLAFSTLACSLPQPEHAAGDEVSVPTLIANLDSKEPAERQEAAYELGLRGEEAVSAVPKLLGLLRMDADVGVRLAAAYALARAGRKDKSTVPVLIEALKKDLNAPVRSNAAGTLGDLGTSAKAAVPALVQALKDSDKSVRINAAVSLGKIGLNELADEALYDALADKSRTVRVVAAVSLLKGRPQKKAPFVVVIEAVKRDEDLKSEDDKHACFAAGGFLISINEKHASMVPALVDALKDGNAHVRHCAAHSLGLIGSSAKAAIPALKESLKDNDAQVRESGAQALAKIEDRERERPRTNP